MKKYSGHCSASNCYAKKVVGQTSPTFFRFPLDEERSRIWCTRSGRNDLSDIPSKELHKKHYLCSKHFSRNQFVNVSSSKVKRWRLIVTAIPLHSNTLLKKESLEEEQSEINAAAENISELNSRSNIGKSKKGKVSDKDFSKERIIETRSQTSSAASKPVAEDPEPPYLQVCIQHNGYNHDSPILCNHTGYKYTYKDIDGRVSEIDSKSLQEKIAAEGLQADFSYEDQGNVITVKKSVIESYRRENSYYGPLKVIPGMSVASENEVVKECHVSRLEPVDFSVTRKDDRSVSEHELNALMLKTPAIIPSCNSPIKHNPEEESTCFSKAGKQYKICNNVLEVFRDRSGIDKQLELKSVDEVFHTSDDRIGLIPVTVLFIGQKDIAKFSSGVISSRRKKLLRRKNKFRKKKGVVEDEIGPHCYGVNYINWSERGNNCFNDIRKVGIRFIDELLVQDVLHEHLDEFGNSLSSAAEFCNEPLHPSVEYMEPSFPEGSREYIDEIWYFLCSLVKNDRSLIEFQYSMENERWIDIKRTYNIFQIDEESISDIILKVVGRNVDSNFTLSYYVRCFGRLVLTGTILCKRDIVSILRCLGKDKYICIGMDKDKYIYQSDENEMLRKYLKENGQLSMTPFERIQHKRCKVIVTDASDVANLRFERGGRTLLGPGVICRPCEGLCHKLEQLLDPSLRLSSTHQDDFSPPRQRFGPVQSLKVTRSIRKLCTETAFEFVSDAQKELENMSTCSFKGIVSKQQKAFGLDADLSDDERPSSKITENEFENMLSIKRSNEACQRLDKVCNKCGFQAKSMLSMFTHMGNHVGSFIEECNSCNAQFPSEEALLDHKKQKHPEDISICPICQQTYLNLEDFFYHMNSHRPSKPFVCLYCDQRHQTIDMYRKHMKTMHHMGTIKEMNFMCQMCQTYFYTRDHLFIHCLNYNHLKKVCVKCSICNFTCDSTSALQSHILNHTYDQREFHNSAICLECKKLFFSSYELEDHTRKVHGDILAKQKQVLPDLESDKKNNSDKPHKSYSCGKCFEKFGTFKALQTHLESSHVDKRTEEQTLTNPNIPVAYSVSCNVCGLKFNSDYSLNLHACNRPEFQCNDVGYMYTKRIQAQEDHMIRNDHIKQAEKTEQMLPAQSQPQQLTSYNPHFLSQQQTSFPENQASPVAGQAHEIQAQPSANSWNQQHTAHNLDEIQDSVYSLLHL